MRVSLFVSMLLAALLIGSGAHAAAASRKIADLVPAEISGWKADGKDGSYNRTNLYDYIDGGAEVYLAYGYKEAFARRFLRADQPGITADLFDMGSADDAYGIFSFEREGKSAWVGQDSEYSAGFLRFWKGRYFVSVLADKETPESKEAVMALGKAIADRIADAGSRPKMLDLLPANSLVSTSVRFFHQKSGLDYHYMVADKNILNLSTKTNVVLAQFKTPAKKSTAKSQLVLVQYPTAKDAVQAHAAFMKAYLPDAKGDSPMETENRKFTVARQKGAFVAVLFDAPDAVYAGALVDAVTAKIEVKAK